MAKYHGHVGYGVDMETTPGIWEEVLTEHEYYGEVVKNKTNIITSDTINSGISINNTISIIADPFAFENFYNMRYVTYLNKKWNITSIEIERPRIKLTLGGLYNE